MKYNLIHSIRKRQMKKNTLQNIFFMAMAGGGAAATAAVTAPVQDADVSLAAGGLGVMAAVCGIATHKLLLWQQKELEYEANMRRNQGMADYKGHSVLANLVASVAVMGTLAMGTTAISYGAVYGQQDQAADGKIKAALSSRLAPAP